MLEVRTIRNNTRTDREAYCFSSVADRAAGKDDIIRQMVKYNSTLTEADAAAALAVIEESVNALLKEGYRVKLPWVSLCFSARGTAESPAETFHPGKGDNRLELNAAPNRKTERKLSGSVNYRKRIGGIIMRPKIDLVTHIAEDASKSEAANVKEENVIRIKGEYLGFSTDDSKQGVFLEAQEQGKTYAVRAKTYIRRTRRTIDTMIPRGISPGEYRIMVVTKEKTSGYMEARSQKTITVGG